MELVLSVFRFIIHDVLILLTEFGTCVAV